MSESKIPSSILIIGSGVFGLSTAYELCLNPAFKDTSITLVERRPFPAPDGSSIDSSRIVRADYADPAYASLVSSAMPLWRSTWGEDGRYNENGLCMTCSPSAASYVQRSAATMQSLGAPITLLNSPAEIKAACGVDGCTGSSGYLNRAAGWVDAEACMRWLYSKIKSLNRVTFITATVSRLLIDHSTATVFGALLTTTNTPLLASLTILAAGAWTPSLLDLRGICTATGQVMAYIPLTPAEQAALRAIPTILNLSTGLFSITPSRNLLKIARHGYGYANPVAIPHPEYIPASTFPSQTSITVSQPLTAVSDPTLSVPAEGLAACRAFLREVYPSLAERPFSATRICWYTDTPTGDFLVSYHPKYKGLFVATGGSGHAFKMLPVIGGKVVECILGRTPAEFRDKWAWPSERVGEDGFAGDGSRGGAKGMLLREEMGRGSRL
ncbi:sarcosine oxidase [Mytilinidion resinicola]|uniref:Sarcosine oxidase n=1 Tax=Mytilinidion resinicola TaxID=574789 RepID=A0A6A6Z0V3_9PEZI|nr:sarcosine oxidase [Mytilinidion resinicola]KAF2813904.1 sarcosine oxidase [Mytilinidion resinicola]